MGWDVRARPLIGGHPAVDLVNTVWWRRSADHTTDLIGYDPTALMSWAEAADVIDTAEARALREWASAAPQDAAEALGQVHHLRKIVYGLLEAAARAREPFASDLCAFHQLSLDARRHTDYAGSLPLSWSHERARTLDGLRHRLTLLAEELLTSQQALRIRQCEGPGCGLMFLDRTRGRTRRWCSSGDCGNRDRARRHYARTQQA